MENALLMTAADVDMIAQAIAMYCMVWYFVCRLGYEAIIYLVRHLHSLKKSAEGKFDA